MSSTELRGATVVFRIAAPDGAVVATLAIEGAEFWVADESPEHQNFSPETLKGSTTRLVLTVEDPDAMFTRAVAAGARVVRPMGNEYGWRLGRVLDPFGHPLGNRQTAGSLGERLPSRKAKRGSTAFER